MGQREAVDELPPESRPPVQGLESSGRNRAPDWHRQQSRGTAGTRQGLRTKILSWT